MRRALLLCCLAAVVQAEEPAFLETVTARQTYFVHEPIRLRLRIGFDHRYFETNVVRLFQQDLDVQMKVQAPWLDELSGTVRLTGDPATGVGRRLSLALNDDVVEALRVEEGCPYTVLEIEKTVVATRPGELVIPAPTLRFAYGTEFKEDLFNERVAKDRRDAVVNGKPLTLEIRALPVEGRALRRVAKAVPPCGGPEAQGSATGPQPQVALPRDVARLEGCDARRARGWMAGRRCQAPAD